MAGAMRRETLLLPGLPGHLSLPGTLEQGSYSMEDWRSRPWALCEAERPQMLSGQSTVPTAAEASLFRSLPLPPTPGLQPHHSPSVLMGMYSLGTGVCQDSREARPLQGSGDTQDRA